MKLPQVDKVLRHPFLLEAEKTFRRDLLVELVRNYFLELRASEPSSDNLPDIEEIAAHIARQAQGLSRPSLRKVINGTGVVLNTNLGRAPLPAKALSRLSEVAGGYCNLEIDLHSGKRGQRSRRIADLLALLTGAESALVVNNNAAAVLLAVNCLAKDREVLVSRGELIEIGGSFRLPDVIEAGGARLKEVGTTNRTRASDYVTAINERTGLLIRCHRSNFEIKGFTEEVSLDELVALSREREIPLLEDLGSGVLFDLKAAGLKDEPTVKKVMASGCDLVSFSGDKLLGGPQAGIIAGKKAIVERLHKHPLYRALRPDKVILALLEQVLVFYLRPDPENEIPVLQMMSAPGKQIKLRAQKFADSVNQDLSGVCLKVKETRSAAGGGSLPGDEVESFGVVIKCALKPNQIARHLRDNEPPIVPIVQNDEVTLDFRTIDPDEEEALMQALRALAKKI